MPRDVLSCLLTSNLAAGVAVLALFVLRRTARVLLGARAAYALWLVVPTAMAATLLPARTIMLTTPVSAVWTAPEPAAFRVSVSAPRTVPQPSLPAPPPRPPINIEPVLLALWLAGIAVSLGLLAIGQRRAVARFGRLTQDRDNRRVVRAARDRVGPALLGTLRPRIVIPADFERVFDAAERELILAHEGAHLAAGDTLVNAAVALLKAVNWFNPLFYVAARLIRIDQELACDAAVIARHPGRRQAYANALVKTQLTATPLPLGCYWPVRSTSLLMERVEMLDRRSPSRLRLLAGGGAIAAMTAGAGMAAWAAQPAVQVQAPRRTGAQPLIGGPVASGLRAAAPGQVPDAPQPTQASLKTSPYTVGEITQLPSLSEIDMAYLRGLDRRELNTKGGPSAEAIMAGRLANSLLRMETYDLSIPLDQGRASLRNPIPTGMSIASTVTIVMPDGATLGPFSSATTTGQSTGYVANALYAAETRDGVTPDGLIATSKVMVFDDTPILIRDLKLASGQTVQIPLPNGALMTLSSTLRPMSETDKANADLIVARRAASERQFVQDVAARGGTVVSGVTPDSTVVNLLLIDAGIRQGASPLANDPLGIGWRE